MEIKKMKLFKKNVEVRSNALIPVEHTSKRGNYISNVIRKKYYNYYNINHRVAVCKMDAVAKRLTYIWAMIATTKTFKFYSSHEMNAVEVMEDIRAKWEELNCKEIFRKCIPPMVRDGYVLLELRNKGEALKYDVYGEYESAPTLWARGVKNIIHRYRIQYTPQPRGMGSSAPMLEIAMKGIDNMRMINETRTPKQIIHMEYGEANYGLGSPLIEGAWDSIIKLALVSHQEMIDIRTVPELHLVEDDYDEEGTKAKDMINMVANSDEDTARIWYHEKLANNEISEYPIFQNNPLTTTSSKYGSRNEKPGVSTGDYGNVSAEWTRLCTVTGHTINYFMGNRAGAVVGSETDKLADDEQETIDFSQVEVIIRKILEWLDAKGIINMPSKPFVIKYWKDWERIELWKDFEKEKEKEEEKDKEKEMGTEPADQQDNKPEDKKSNKSIQDIESSEVVVDELANMSNKVPILDYKLIDSIDTVGMIKKLGKKVNWSMGTGTATNIQNMLNELKRNTNKHQFRVNTMTAEAFGNSIKENYPLMYDIGGGVIVEEYICPDSWKKNVGKKVPLGVYHNIMGNIPELPDWQIIGDAEIFGWDDESGEDFVKYNYDYGKITSVFEHLAHFDWLTPSLKENGTSDISTAYYCDIEHRWNDSTKRFIRIQTNIQLISISFVPIGNCPGEVCSLKEIKKNANLMQTYIKNCIAEGIEKEKCLAKAYSKFKAKT